jgi:serine/threonine-protein kinase
MPSIPPPAPLLEPGFRLDRYELLCKIGQGGMATVWLARTRNSHGEERLVAIKTILAGLAADDSLRAMLLDEARIAQGIDHPNVAATLEVGQLWDMPYLVLEYVEGESVDTLCKALADLELPVPAAVAIRIVADAALGLHEAHELTGADGASLGIVHRDISPPNILVDERGRARVIDFGVAKATERFTPETAAGVMKGRVPYMAPEHASGGAVDRRADVWSLGAVAYFMLAGRYPFDGPNDAARLIRILGTDEPDPLPDSVAPTVREVIMRALSKDPDARHATAAELAAALEASELRATHDEVARFFEATLASSIKARHTLVEHALAAADARARAREMLDGPMTGSTTYRPPAVIAASAEVSPATGAGTLGTVTRTQRPAPRAWLPWATAAALSVVVIVAFALGSFTARPPGSVEPTGTSTTFTNGDARAHDLGTNAGADAGGVNVKTDADAKGEAMAKAKAAASAAQAKAAAERRLAAGTKATAASSGAPPSPPTSKAATSAVKPSPSDPSSSKPSSSKPASTKPEAEDTIY